jgi:phosphoglycolate phosphatase-like HAD superfamily hydrolase
MRILQRTQMHPRERLNLDDLKRPGAERFVLFLDDGGVMNDNALRGPEWVRLIAEFMPDRMGGTGEQWASANPLIFGQVWADLQKHLPEFRSHKEFQRTLAVNWMRGMCGRIGLTPPPDDETTALYDELSAYVAERAVCAIAGAADAVRSLHGAGYTLYTASGTTSWELRGILGRMGIAEMFSGLYGPDVVDHVKYGPAFYDAVFAHAGVAPDRAAVIDSDSECCEWAREARASAVWIDPDGRGDATTLESFVRQLLTEV